MWGRARRWLWAVSPSAEHRSSARMWSTGAAAHHRTEEFRLGCSVVAACVGDLGEVVKLIIRFEDGDWNCSHEADVTAKDAKCHPLDFAEACIVPALAELLPDVRARLREQAPVVETDQRDR